MVLSWSLSCDCSHIVREVLGLESSKVVTGSTVQDSFFPHMAGISTSLAAAAETD